MKIKTLVLFSFFLSMKIAFANSEHYLFDDPFRFASKGLYCAKSSFDEIFPVGLAVRVDQSFSESAQKVIASAVNHLLEEIFSEDVFNCANANSSEDLQKDYSAFASNLFSTMMYQTDGDKLVTRVPMMISRVLNRKDSFGEAYVSYSKFKNHLDPFLQGDRSLYYIALNSEYLGQESFYVKSTSPSFWAGIIAHLMLHNLGYQHGSDDEQKSFVYQFGACLERKILLKTGR